MARPLFKNKKLKYSFDELPNDTDTLDDIPSIFSSNKINVYNESEDGDLDVLDNLISGNYKKVAKDRKKKYKKEEKKKKKKQKKDKKKLKKQEEDLLDLQQVYGLDEKGINRKKLGRNDEEFYESRFNGSLIILRELLKQVNSQIVTSQSLQEYFKNANFRGSLKAMTDQGANISSLLGTKLQVIKEVNNVNKTVSDLELKRAKENKDNNKDAEANEDYIINKIFSNVVNGDVDVSDLKNNGKKKDKKDKDKKKKRRKPDYLDEEDDDDDIVEDFSNPDDMYNVIKDDQETELIEDPQYSDDDEDEDPDNYLNEDSDIDDDYDPDDDDIDRLLDARIHKLEKKGEIKFNDVERAYKDEDRVEIIVVKNPKTERWRFMAIDKYTGEEIYDYPLPIKNAMGRMKFDKETGIAKDMLNHTYRIEYDKKLDI